MKIPSILNFSNFAQHTLKDTNFGTKELSFKSVLSKNKLKDEPLPAPDKALFDEPVPTEGQKLNFLA